jgi:AbrB family looped-hinge helix DNA binding protein
MEVVTLSSKGQVVIPAKVRKKFSLKEGDSLVLVEENEGIRLQPITNLSELWGADQLKETGQAVRKLRKEWDDDLEKSAAL